MPYLALPCLALPSAVQQQSSERLATAITSFETEKKNYRRRRRRR